MQNMNQDLTVTYLHPDPSPQGPQAVLSIREPNGNVHVVRCLILGDVTHIAGPSATTLPDLHARYGPSLVLLCRQAVLHH